MKKLYVIPTYHCNLKCPHCELHLRDDNFNESFYDVLSNNNIDLGVLFGGEPTLYRDRLIKCLKTNKIHSISTNLIKLDNELISLLKSQYPNVKIVQLGSSRCTQLKNIDINLIGKTTFSECMALLDASALHIDCECGMTHVRHFLSQKPSVVMFGPTSVSTRGYPENINLRANVCNCELCEWLIGGDWQCKCIKTGTNFAPCMHAITPQMVIDAIKKHDNGNLDKLLSSVA